jgi:hypothetical protein
MVHLVVSIYYLPDLVRHLAHRTPRGKPPKPVANRTDTRALHQLVDPVRLPIR